MANERVRKVAFYLPQFHPVPENDEWWGRGFTDWLNVARARPLFRGHLQPNLPADLGFYDLRIPEVRESQAELARAAGVDAFCYYHYWFLGRRILNRPFDEVLASGSPDLPFCLCWANESWTRSWDGRSGQVLIEQRYGVTDDREHVAWLLEAFRDPRYLRLAGRPVFLVYRASLLPDPRRTTDLWREEARRAGLGELHLCRVESFPQEQLKPPSELGFDAAVEFQPDWRTFEQTHWRDLLLGLRAPGGWAGLRTGVRINDYGAVARRMMAKPLPAHRRHPGVAAGWDNTPRRRRGGVVLHHRQPEVYQRWLEHACERERATSGDGLVFLNAWNEWAEGNYLEPCQRFGRAFLEATRAAS